MSLHALIETLGQDARASARAFAKIQRPQKDQALLRIADALETRKAEIQEANRLDLQAADAAGMQGARRGRLVLSDKVLAEMRQGLLDVAALPDPVGEVVKMWTRPNGLQVGRIRIPLGVIGFIYESRPNVTIEASALCLKAGNAILLRGGSEAIHSNRCLTSIVQDALAACGLPAKAVQLVQTTEREAITELLKRDDLIDVLIPRGGESLIRFVCEHARMPVLKHDKGVCHLYADDSADIDSACSIIVNAKAQRPGVCNALDGLLVHAAIAPTLLPRLAPQLHEAGVEIRACERSAALLPDAPNLRPASPSDWGCEFLSLVLAVRIVDSIDEAIRHIETYGSSHTDGILTQHYQRAHRFVQEVQSSLVIVNASTRFNDGFQLGLGAEIGISTSKLHAFGPMGLEELTTCKFVAFGQGQIRS